MSMVLNHLVLYKFTPKKQMTDPWHFIDAVYAITLDTATHRHQKLKDEMTRVQLQDKLHMMVVTRHPEGGIRGCYESHADAWKQARAQGHRCILVVEDDVFFSNDWKTYLPHVAHFVQHSNTPWHLLLLGWTPFRSTPVPANPHISAVVRSTAMHAYLVSAAAMDRGIPPFRNLAVDIELFYAGKNKAPKSDKKRYIGHNNWLSFALKPMIAFQRYDSTSSTGNSDIANKFKARIGVMRFAGSVADHVDVACFIKVGSMVGIIILVLLILLTLLLVQRSRK
jgi:hypothetical protein